MKILTPIKAIREKCLDCCCYSSLEVRLCPAEDCTLHPYRLGKNPNIGKREYTDEQQAVMRERAKALHMKKNTTLQS